jgi:hypothetical protein
MKLGEIYKTVWQTSNADGLWVVEEEKLLSRKERLERHKESVQNVLLLSNLMSQVQ